MQENKIIISIVVCCYNASKRISDTVYGLVNQSALKEKYEVIVVDNNSDDYGDLFKVIKKIDFGECNFKIIREMNLGLSYARNRGVKESKGEYVYFIDDDAVPCAQLVDAYIKAITDNDPDVIGGNIVPFFEVKPPTILDSSVWEQWSIKYFGEADRWLIDGDYFLGTNVGAKRNILLNHQFDPALGRKGTLYFGGEEWYLGDKKFTRRFVAKAFVFHKVSAKKVEMQYFIGLNIAWHIQMNRDYKLISILKDIMWIIKKNIKKSLSLMRYDLALKYNVYKKLKDV